MESKKNDTAEVSFSVAESRGNEEHDSGVDNSKQEERMDFQVPPGSEHFNATLPGESNEKPPILEKNQGKNSLLSDFILLCFVESLVSSHRILDRGNKQHLFWKCMQRYVYLYLIESKAHYLKIFWTAKMDERKKW